MPTRLEELLALSVRPIAIAFLAQAPAGLARIARAAPASCSYWRRAADGEAFYTEAADYLGCAVGAHTHGVPTSPDLKQADLMALIGTMVGLEYLAMDEVPGIRIARSRRASAWSPTCCSTPPPSRPTWCWCAVTSAS